MSRMVRKTDRLQRGFTMVEAVVTIVITAILSVGVINYISDSVEGFTSASNRNQLSSAGRTVIDRLALELNNAVPNSIRVRPDPERGDVLNANGNQCLEFLPFEATTSVIDAPFMGQEDIQLDIVPLKPSLDVDSAIDNYYAVLYPNDTPSIYDLDTTNSPRTGPIAQVADICSAGEIDCSATAGLQTIELVADHRYPRRSFLGRLFITREPVSFCLVDGRIFRYGEYGFSADQCVPDEVETAAPGCLPTTSGGGRHLVTDSVDNSGNGSPLTAFSVLAATQRRNAVIAIDLSFTDRGDTVRLTHDVLSRNVP